MQQTRVPKGENYWYIASVFFAGDFYVTYGVDFYEDIQDGRFAMGNYFHTKEEAESMARKLNAVLKGTDIIEMPSKSEIKKEISKLVRIIKGRSHDSYADMGTNFITNLLESKIVK